MTSKPDDNMAHSLVPELRQQEERLLAELEQARAEVAHDQADPIAVGCQANQVDRRNIGGEQGQPDDWPPE